MGYSLGVLTGRYCHEVFSGVIDWAVLSWDILWGF